MNAVQAYRESGGMAPLIVSIGARRTWVIILTPRLFYARQRYLGTHWILDWVGPEGGLDVLEKRQTS